MKVRWTGRSIRLRITPSELHSLENGDAIQESLRLTAASPVIWSVQVIPGAAETSLAVEGPVLAITLSPEEGNRLSEPDREGVYFEHENFRYYIEKDFPCVHPRASEAAEPETGTFPLPAGKIPTGD